MKLSIREIQRSDIDLIIEYWTTSSEEHLLSMGVELAKMPEESQWRAMLEKQISTNYKDKQSYCLIWCLDEQPVGHCNINNIEFGESAHMHLHMWQGSNRRSGLGVEFVRKCLPIFFDKYQLKVIRCEPYRENRAPQKTVEKAGFIFIKEYETVPGSINRHQVVSQWEYRP